MKFNEINYISYRVKLRLSDFCDGRKEMDEEIMSIV